MDRYGKINIRPMKLYGEEVTANVVEMHEVILEF